MKIALLQARISEASTYVPPLGVLYVASYLRQKGHEVIVIDVDPDVDDPTFRLVDFSPDIIGFTIMTVYYRKSDKFIRHVKEHLPRAVICAGGVHPSALPERTVRELGGGIDFVVMGEGELIMAEVLDKMKSGGDYQHVKGTVHRLGEKIINNGRAPINHDLDQFPFPARDLLDMKKYMIPPGEIKGMHRARTTSLISSRGCPAACIYCATRFMFGPGVRRRSADNVIAEIEELIAKYDINGFGFSDDTFMHNKEWVKEFCDKLIEKKWNIKWACITRANTVTDELVRLMYRAGCRQCCIGVESGSERILKSVKKGVDTEQIARAFEITKRNGMNRMGSFMIGFPTEKEEDIRLTASFAKKIMPDFSWFFFVTPYPGTELYDMAIEKGWLAKEHVFGEEWAVRQAEKPVMEVEIAPHRLKRLRAGLQNSFFIRNFLTSMNLPLMALMIWSLISAPKELFNSIRLIISTGRLDYLAEGAVKAYRYKVERPSKKAKKHV